VPTWPNEPDEDDPEDRWPDPEHELPSVPSVDYESRVPSVDPPDAEPSAEELRTFWSAVVLANVGVAGVSFGPLIAYFRGEFLLGAASVAVGVVALVRTYLLYREFREREEADESDGGEDADAGDAGVDVGDPASDGDEPPPVGGDSGRRREGDPSRDDNA
jgi:hypothetical protein